MVLPDSDDFFESLPMAAALLDDSGWLARTNGAWQRRFPAAPPMSRLHIGDLVHPAERARVEELMGRLRHGSVLDTRRADGTRDRLQFVKLPHGNAVLATDPPDEEQSRVVLQQLADGYLEHDAQGTIVDCNPWASEQLGYPASELVGLQLEQLVVDSKGRTDWLHMQSGRPVTRRVEFRRKDGSTFAASLRVSVLERGPRRWFVLFRDLSRDRAHEVQLRRLSGELATARDAAVEANTAKSHFLANMSHELRTPLNAIIGYTELLTEDARDEGRGSDVEDLSKIRGGALHLLALINDILDLSKIEAGRMELYEELISLSDLVDEVMMTASPLAERNQNQLAVGRSPRLGTLRGDPTRVKQVLLNLLSNACKFTEQGKVELQVRGGADEVVFEVRDTGIGIAADRIDRLFEPFTQADATTTRKYGGTGLGLTISKRFVEMMGGTLGVSSVPGEGSTFTVRLPRGHEQVPVVDTELQAPTMDGDEPIVLVIDDDEAVHQLLARLLRREGYQVLHAYDGKAGLALAEHSRPDAILTDIMMPGMDGWEVLANLQNHPDLQDTPVVMMSILEEVRKSYAFGATDYLVKPFRKDQLVAVLKRYRIGNSGGSVLVVDDDQAVRDLARRALIADGWSVEEAVDGLDALQKMRNVRPDAVLLDLMMPRMDGFQVVDALRTDVTLMGIPVVVFTAINLSTEQRRTLEEHVLTVLQKQDSPLEKVLHELKRVTQAE